MERNDIENLSRHALAVAEAYSLLLSVTCPYTQISTKSRKEYPTSSASGQTSDRTDVDQQSMDHQSDPDDDRIFEEVVVHDADDDNSSSLPLRQNDFNPIAELGARNVISELKNILPKTVNQNRNGFLNKKL